MGCAVNPRQPWILIVDDDENVLAIASDLIQRLGYNALVASNGVDTLEILRRNQDVSVLFSDIGMPGMNGEELARAASPPAARCIDVETESTTRETAGAHSSGIPALRRPAK
jgi:CheY-like chemotaxis protein